MCSSLKYSAQRSPLRSPRRTTTQTSGSFKSASRNISVKNATTPQKTWASNAASTSVPFVRIKKEKDPDWSESDAHIAKSYKPHVPSTNARPSQPRPSAKRRPLQQWFGSKKKRKPQRRCRTKADLLRQERAKEARLAKQREKEEQRQARLLATHSAPAPSSSAASARAPSDTSKALASTRARSPLKRTAITSGTNDNTSGSRPPKRNRMLEQLRSSDGYIADREIRNETLLKDRRKLNREERHLQVE